MDHPFEEMPEVKADIRGVPTAECICGSRTFYAVVWLDDAYEMAGYVTDGLCPCGTLLTIATPIDHEVNHD